MSKNIALSTLGVIASGAIVANTFFTKQSENEASIKMTQFLNGYHENVISEMRSIITTYIGSNYITYDDTIKEILLRLDDFSIVISTLPTLLNSDRDDLINDVYVKMNASVNSVILNYIGNWESFTNEIFPNLITNMFEELQKTFDELLSSVEDELKEDLVLHYNEVSSTKMSTILTNIPSVMNQKIATRKERIIGFYEIMSSGILATYGRLISTGKIITSEFLVLNQGKNYVINDIQDTIVNIIDRDLEFSIILDTEANQSEFSTFHFQDALEIKDGISSEIVFRVGSNHMPTLIKNRSFEVFSTRYSSINSDPVLSDGQKNSLIILADSSYKSLLTQLEAYSDTYTEESLTGYSTDYMGAILPKVKTYLDAVFSEFSTVLSRSKMEGVISCISQFFQLRRSMADHVFFPIAYNNNFDIEKTQEIFWAMYNAEIELARSRMIQFVRLDRITILYDDTLNFLNALSGLFFHYDQKIYEKINLVTNSFHEQLADVVGTSIEEGIDEVFEEEKEVATTVVTEVFEEFIENMRVGKISFMISEMMDIVKEEVNAKVSYIVGEVIPPLVTEFRSITFEKFDFEWMGETQKQFITGDGDMDIDFDGMRSFTISEMNAFAEQNVDTYIDLVNQLSDAQILSIGESMIPFVESIREQISGSNIDDVQKEALYNSLSSSETDINGFLNSTKTSFIVALNSLIQQEIESMDVSMDNLTQSFFDTSQQLIVEEFSAWANNEMTNMWTNRIEDLVASHFDLAVEAKKTFEAHILKLVELEIEHRKPVEVSASSELEKQSKMILEEYDIISYGYNKTGIQNELKAAITMAVSEQAGKRKQEIWNIEQEYAISKARFRTKYTEIGMQKMEDFNTMYGEKLTSAYERFSDVLNIPMVSDALKILGGGLRKSYTENYNNIATSYLMTFDNDLPLVDMSNICYPGGLIPVAGSEIGDIQSIMEPHLIAQNQQLTGQTEFEDGEVVEVEIVEVLSEHEILTYENIVFSMAEYDDWFDGMMELAIEKMEATIDQALKENTCSNKPTCSLDGGCESTQLSCKEHYDLVENSYGIMCCQFNPSSDVKGNSAELVRIIGVEIGIMLFTTPETYSMLSKMSSKLSSVIGSNLRKFARVEKMISKLSKAGDDFAKASYKMGTAVAQKTGFKFGKKLGAKFSGKLGIAVGKEALKKVVASAAMKTLTKTLASGPFAIAMFVFDVLSLALDLWDPNGFNDVQSLENIVTMRDLLEKQYNASLEAEGIHAPMIANCMYKLSYEKQSELISELFMEWFIDEITLVTSANEERWGLMSNSSVAKEYDDAIEEISARSSHVNFMAELIYENTEDTMLVRASSTVGTDPSIIGTSSDPDFDTTTGTHRMVCTLTELGVENANNFNKIKNDFMNILTSTHMYRWVKIENGYRVYRRLSDQEMSDAQAEITRRDFLREENNLSSAEASAPILYRIGWSLERVNPEEEFWLQHRYKQEMGNEKYQSPENFYIVWNWLQAQNELEYETSILTAAEDFLKTVFSNQNDIENVTLDMLKNKDENSPTWYPEYIDLYNYAKEQIDSNIKEVMEEEQAEALEAEELTARQNVISDELAATEAGISVDEARNNRVSLENGSTFVETEPDFAVFRNGYGQVSSLYSINTRCQEMEHGVTFSPETGLCKFTKSYCNRYGLDYKFNSDYGEYDCNLSGHQRVAESIFGTSIVRTFRGGGTREGHLKTLRVMFPLAFLVADAATERPLLGVSQGPKPVPKTAIEVYRGLDSLGLGSNYSLS